MLRAPSLVLGSNKLRLFGNRRFSVSKTKSSGAPSGALKATPSVAAAEAKLRKRCAREFSTVFRMEHCFFVFNGHIIFLAMMSYTQILLKSYAFRINYVYLKTPGSLAARPVETGAPRSATSGALRTNFVKIEDSWRCRSLFEKLRFPLWGTTVRSHTLAKTLKSKILTYFVSSVALRQRLRSKPVPLWGTQ